MKNFISALSATGILKPLNDDLAAKGLDVVIGTDTGGLTINRTKKAATSQKSSAPRRQRGRMLLSKSRPNAAQGIRD
tara:strand:- start:1620 stop:1850 length:231 start_codon:yes stop_codon:yes gene_type:complete